MVLVSALLRRHLSISNIKVAKDEYENERPVYRPRCLSRVDAPPCSLQHGSQGYNGASIGRFSNSAQGLSTSTRHQRNGLGDSAFSRHATLDIQSLYGKEHFPCIGVSVWPMGTALSHANYSREEQSLEILSTPNRLVYSYGPSSPGQCSPQTWGWLMQEHCS